MKWLRWLLRLERSLHWQYEPAIGTRWPVTKRKLLIFNNLVAMWYLNASSRELAELDSTFDHDWRKNMTETDMLWLAVKSLGMIAAMGLCLWGAIKVMEG